MYRKVLGIDWDDMVVAYISDDHPEYEGLTIPEAAKREGLSELDMYLKLVKLSNRAGSIYLGKYYTAEIVRTLMEDDLSVFMTDAWVEDHGIQNPAIYDCDPKFLRDSLCGTGDTLPNTIRRMTGAVADRFMIPERGYLREGYFADLTVFDEEALKSGTPDQKKPFGIDKVFINGTLVLEDGRLDKEALKTTGRSIRIA